MADLNEQDPTVPGGETPPGREGPRPEGEAAAPETEPRLDVLDASGGAEAPTMAPEEEEDDGFMSAADAKLAEANERYVRLAADFDNFRKRAAKERIEAAGAAYESLLLDLLPVVDNLERALAAGGGSGESAGVVKGVELTLRQFQGVLGRLGVERLVAVGEPFDPHRHEALAHVESADAAPDTVLEEFEAGYVMKGRVIRPAKVKVAKAPAAAPEPGPV